MAIPAIAAALGRGAAGGASGSLAGVSQSLGRLKGSAQGAAGSVDRINQGVQKMGAVSASVVNALAAGSNAIKALAAPMAQFVALKAPAAVKQFELALNDMGAVIGNMLLPVFNALTAAARSMGDTYATLQDSIAPVMSGIADAITVVFKEIGSVARDNAGAIKVMAEVMGVLARAWGSQVSIVLKVVSALGKFFNLFRIFGDALGFGKPGEKSARGQAVRNVSIGKSGEDVARKAQEAAFMQGMGGAKPEDPVKTGFDRLMEWLETNLSAQAIKEYVLEFASAVTSGSASKVADSTVGKAIGAFNPLVQAARAANSLLTR